MKTKALASIFFGVLILASYQNCTNMKMTGEAELNSNQCNTMGVIPPAKIDYVVNGNQTEFFVRDASNNILNRLFDWSFQYDFNRDYNNLSRVTLDSNTFCDQFVEITYFTDACNNNTDKYSEVLNINCNDGPSSNIVFEQDVFDQNTWSCTGTRCGFINNHLFVDGYYGPNEWAYYDFSNKPSGVIENGNYKVSVRVAGGNNHNPAYDKRTGARGYFEIVKADGTSTQIWTDCLTSQMGLQFANLSFDYSGSIKTLRFQAKAAACTGETTPWPMGDGEFITVDYVKIEQL